MVRVGKENSKKQIIAAIGILIVLAAAYTAVIPTVVANHYLNQIGSKAEDLEPKLKRVANGPSRQIFLDPDLKLQERQALIALAMQDLSAARTALNELEKSNTLSRLPGNGFAGDYHEAIVRKEMASNMVNQTRQVLDRYSVLLGYLNTYTVFQLSLENRLNDINAVRDFNALVGKGKSMEAVASEIGQNRLSLSETAPPSGFEQLQTEALATFDKSAAGFTKLAKGLNASSDSQIYGAVKELEALTDKNQLQDKNLLVELSVNSQTLRQLDELPEKVEHSLGR